MLFECRWERSAPLAASQLQPLRNWRGRLHSLGLIGVNQDGVGYGNLSSRKDGSSQFVISGTGTGTLAQLGPAHFTTVTDCDFESNSLSCQGPCRASSESLSHAAVYRSSPATGAVIHVHNSAMWESLYRRIPTTDPRAEAGTPEMARAIEELMKKHDGPGLFVMGGHQDGLMAQGKDLEEAAGHILSALNSML